MTGVRELDDATFANAASLAHLDMGGMTGLTALPPALLWPLAATLASLSLRNMRGLTGLPEGLLQGLAALTSL